jgi:HUS1 checkpoint protein
MRFRGVISREMQSIFHTIILSFEKSGANAVIFLDEESMRISLITDNIESPKCYADISVNELFNDYRINSQTNNTILFELRLSQLSQALSSGKTSSQCQLKLAKRDGKPCLCFETKASESSLSVDVKHDIPITVLKFSEGIYHMPPNVNPPNVALDLPNNKIMKTVTDKMMKVTKYTHLTASQSGHIVFRTTHTSADISTHFNGLRPRFVGDLNPANDMDNKVTIKLSLRSLSNVLNLFNLPAFGNALG